MYQLLIMAFEALLIWVGVINIARTVLRRMENDSSAKNSIEVTIVGYDGDTDPPVVYAKQPYTHNYLFIPDYEGRYGLAINPYIGKDVTIYFKMRYTGIFLICVTQEIYSIVPKPLV